MESDKMKNLHTEISDLIKKLKDENTRLKQELATSKSSSIDESVVQSLKDKNQSLENELKQALASKQEIEGNLLQIKESLEETVANSHAKEQTAPEETKPASNEGQDQGSLYSEEAPVSETTLETPQKEKNKPQAQEAASEVAPSNTLTTNEIIEEEEDPFLDDDPFSDDDDMEEDDENFFKNVIDKKSE